MSKELPADDFPFLDRLLAEIKLLREAKRSRRIIAPPLEQEIKPNPSKRECMGYMSILSRHMRQTKAVTKKANEATRGQR